MILPACAHCKAVCVRCIAGSRQQYLTLKAAKSAGVQQSQTLQPVLLYPMNYFTPVTNNSYTNVTGQLGASAYLPCRTQHSLEREVKLSFSLQYQTDMQECIQCLASVI